MFLDREDVMNGEQEETNEFLVRDLREKIKSKMDIAKTLGAIFAGLLAAIVTFVSSSQLSSGLGNDHCWSQCVPFEDFYRYTFLFAILFTTVAVVLFFGTMYAYDRILMPRQFWKNDHSADALYRLMSESWSRLFNVASFFLAVCFLDFTIVLLKFGISEIVALVGCVVIAVIYSRFAVERIRFLDYGDRASLGTI